METCLTIDLFAPGMSPLHRAGLGGLAATIHRLGWKPEDGFSYDDRCVTLDWKEPERSREFFKTIYERAFGIRDGLIHLPGSYGSLPPSPEVMAELQQGLSQTILQFGPNRKAEGPRIQRTYRVDDCELTIEHQNLVKYTHCSAWEELFDSKGQLATKVPISGTIAPGFMQRHNVHGSTKHYEGPAHAIALHFALVGTLSLSVDSRSGVLIVPDVDDLRTFVRLRGLITPNNPRECRIAGFEDAALQAFVRLRNAEAAQDLKLRRCYSVLFTTQKWNENQKSRAAVISIEPELRVIRLFDVAMQNLPPRVIRPAITKAKEKKGQDSRRFWARSVVRPLVAENLARGRPWYQDFRRLVVGPNGGPDEKKVMSLGFERKGLQAMIDAPWDDQREERLIEAIHQAMKQRFGEMWEQSHRDKVTFENRFKRQMQEWRLSLAHGKTADDVRHAIADLLSSAGQVRPLMDHWREIRVIFSDESRWQLNRDLALLALASYRSERTEAGPEGDGGAEVLD